MSLEEKNLSEDELIDEINKFHSLQQNHNKELKKLYNNEKTLITDYYFKFKDDTLTFNLPITFSQQSDSVNNILLIKIIDGNETVFQKEIIFPKYINIDEKIKEINNSILSENIIIKIENLLSKINRLNIHKNNEDDNYIQWDKSQFSNDELQSHKNFLKIEYEALILKIKELNDKKNFLLSIKKDSAKKLNNSLFKLNEIERFLNIESSHKYFKLMEMFKNNDDQATEKLKEYLKHKKKIRLSVEEKDNEPPLSIFKKKKNIMKN